MEVPVYCIINGKPVKAVRTEHGELEVLEFVPEDDAFVRNMSLSKYIFLPSPGEAMDTELTSRTEFEAYVAKIRRKAKVKRIVSLLPGLIRRSGKDVRSRVEPESRRDVASEQAEETRLHDRKVWRLEGYDSYACEFYRLEGEYQTKREAIAAGKERDKQTSDWIYVVAPDGSHFRLSDV